MPIVKFARPEDLRALAAACRMVGDGGEVRKEFIKAMRPVVNRAAEDVRSTVRALPVSARATWQTGNSGFAARTAYQYRQSGYKSTRRARSRGGLRESIARSTRTSIRTGGRNPSIRVRVDPKGLPPDQRKLPMYLDSPKGWRHPLFGNRSKWVHQQGKPYFATTLNEHAPEYAAAAGEVIDRISRRIGF